MLKGVLVVSKPPNGCTTMDPPPKNLTTNTTKYIVLIKRYECNFDIKVSKVENGII